MKKLRPRAVDRPAQSHAAEPCLCSSPRHVGCVTPSLMQMCAPQESTCDHGRAPPCPGGSTCLESLGWSWHPSRTMPSVSWRHWPDSVLHGAVLQGARSYPQRNHSQYSGDNGIIARTNASFPPRSDFQVSALLRKVNILRKKNQPQRAAVFWDRCTFKIR